MNFLLWWIWTSLSVIIPEKSLLDRKPRKWRFKQKLGQPARPNSLQSRQKPWAIKKLARPKTPVLGKSWSTWKEVRSKYSSEPWPELRSDLIPWKRIRRQLLPRSSVISLSKLLKSGLRSRVHQVYQGSLERYRQFCSTVRQCVNPKRCNGKTLELFKFYCTNYFILQAEQSLTS